MLTFDRSAVAGSGGATSGSWQPLLTGTLAEQARRTIDAIATSLARPAPGPGHDGTIPQPGETASVAGGAAGLALFYAYRAHARDGRHDTAVAVRHLEQAIDAVATAWLGPTLYGGFTGVAWATSHLTGRLVDSDADDPNVAIDTALLAFLDQSPWRHDYDLIAGLVGYGVYALERLPQPAAVTLLERVVAHLATMVERRPDGLTWWTDPAWLPADNRARSPHGYYNLGLAHGVPGVIALLGATCAAGVAVATARPLLDGAVRWLLAQRLPPDAGACFTHWLEEGLPPTPSRLAWCYGDLGLAAALLLAARGVGDLAWEREALAIARHAAARPADQAGVRDAGLCHGAAGVAHLFNRLYQASGEPLLGEAARAWFARTLALRRPGRGIAGYQAWAPGADRELTWLDDPGLLTGAAGIGLALLAAVTATEPAWDRLLLVNVPPRPQSAGA